MLKPALTRKEARQRERERRAQARAAMLDGDERSLMPRDQGPVRRATRDYVDGRRNGGELFLPAALLILLLGFVRSLFVQQLSLLLWLVLIAVIAVDAAVMVRGLKRSLRRRFPDENLKGITFYAVMRALQIRRLRVPKVQARPGDTRRAAQAERSPGA